MVLQDTRVKDVIKVLGVVLLIQVVIIPLFRTWNWREDECQLFELAAQFNKNETTFYNWLDVEPTSTAVEIGKAYRKLTLHMHPTAHADQTTPEYDITKQVGYILRTPKLRSLYDSILLQNGKLPFFKGWYHLWTRHKLPTMTVCIVLIGILLDYIRQWDNYFKEKIVIDEFIRNAKVMAQRLDSTTRTGEERDEQQHQGGRRKHRKKAAAKNTAAPEEKKAPMTHKSYIDFGDRVVKCEITKEKEIFLLNEKNERLPFIASNVIKKPSVCHLNELFK